MLNRLVIDSHFQPDFISFSDDQRSILYFCTERGKNNPKSGGLIVYRIPHRQDLFKQYEQNSHTIFTFKELFLESQKVW